MDFSSFKLAEQQVNARGAKFCPLFANSHQVQLTLGSKANPLSTQWGPSSFDQAQNVTRRNMDFVCTPQMEDELKKLDDWTVEYVEQNCQRLFGKTLTKAQVADGYKPSCTERGDYPKQLRCKINLQGPREIRCWDEHGQPREQPLEWKRCKFVARVTLSHLWVMSKEFGWVFNITDLQIFEERHDCPFV